MKTEVYECDVCGRLDRRGRGYLTVGLSDARDDDGGSSAVAMCCSMDCLIEFTAENAQAITENLVPDEPTRWGFRYTRDED